MAVGSGRLKALESNNLREQAKATIRTGILTGEIAAGNMYSARTLAEELEVSATPVREALLDLVNEGLVTPVRNRGFLVVETSAEDLDEIFQLRSMLEIPATRIAAERITDGEVDTLRGLAEETGTAARKADLAAFLNADLEFHILITNCVHNARLTEQVERLRRQARLTGLGQLSASGGLEQAVREHHQIVDALEARDADLAERVMREHIQHTRGVWAGLTETEAD